MSKVKVQELSTTSLLNKDLAEKLIGDLFEISQEDLFLRKNEIYLTPAQITKFKKTEKEIAGRGIPYQYAIGKAEFYGREFFANKNVLIPRPETELLVRSAIQFIRNKGNMDTYVRSDISVHVKPAKLKMIDVGTGSGCIAISLASEIAKLKADGRQLAANLYAVDINEKTLNVAKKNARNHKVKIKFMKSDLLSNKKLPRKFDLILANLPYLPSSDIVLENSIKFEPKIALDGGEDGLDLVKKLIAELPERLEKDGLAILEIDPRQKTKITEFANKLGLQIEFQKDLNNRTRFALLSANSVFPQT